MRADDSLSANISRIVRPCIFSFNYFTRVGRGQARPGRAASRPGESRGGQRRKSDVSFRAQGKKKKNIFVGFAKLPVTGLQINVITAFIYFAAQSMTGFVGVNQRYRPAAGRPVKSVNLPFFFFVPAFLLHFFPLSLSLSLTPRPSRPCTIPD